MNRVRGHEATGTPQWPLGPQVAAPAAEDGLVSRQKRTEKGSEEETPDAREGRRRAGRSPARASETQLRK